MFKDFLGKLIPKVGNKKEENVEEEKPKPEGEVCALCQGEDPDKKWMGQRWHTKCLRVAKKQAKKMV